jgi:hypothetical protein
VASGARFTWAAAKTTAWLLRWEEEDDRPSSGVLAREVALPEVTLPAGSQVELSLPAPDAPQTIFAALVERPITIAGFVVPGGSKLEFEDSGHLAGVTLGEAIGESPLGPHSQLTFDRDAWISFIDGRWAFTVEDALR